MLVAIRDVEDALTDLYSRWADAARSQNQAVQLATREYVRLAEQQYRQARELPDRHRRRCTLLNNELSAAQILNQRLVSTVLLIESPLAAGGTPRRERHAVALIEPAISPVAP